MARDVSITRDDVQALLHKLTELRDLSAQREEAQSTGLSAFPPDLAAVRKARMRALGARFPGALRELDGVTPTLVDARVAELRAWLDKGKPLLEAEAIPWAVAQHMVHRALGEHLEARRKGGPSTARPMAEVCMEEVARRLGTSPRQIQAWIYPYPNG